MRVLPAVGLVVMVLAVLLVSLASPSVLNGRTPGSTSASGTSGASPALITPHSGWDGIDYNHSCATCLEANPQIATGVGDVFEMVNGSYSVWTVGGDALAANSLDALFGAGHDPLVDPQVRFEPTSQRWFASADDLRSGTILYGVSETSDPTAGWTVNHFNVVSNAIPERSSLAVNSINLVVSTNLYSRSTGLFLGGQTWVANLTDLTAGTTVATWSSAANLSQENLIPAQPASQSRMTYLVGDGAGNATSFELFTLSGSPPRTPTLSSPSVFPISATTPPAAVQANSSDRIDLGNGGLTSAVWRSGTLWAAATSACVPSGDSSVRACLHLWDVSTTLGTMTQDILWSTGPRTYDFDPALSTNGTGDLTVVFGESSATLDPSVLVTGHTDADPLGALEPAVFLKVGTGPVTAGGACPAGICPFASYFGVGWAPTGGTHVWVVGEYTSTDSSVDLWHTWVASVLNVVTYGVTFAESGLDAGSAWSVALNGNEESSNGSTITFLEPNGTGTYVVLTPVAGATGTRFVAEPTGGSLVIAGRGLAENISFTKEYRLTTSVVPGTAGIVDPPDSWWNAGSTVSLAALANSSFAFRLWEGSGAGAYTGASNPAKVVMDGPISEQATFVNSTTYLITFSASGLPASTPWSATVNGLEENTSGTSMSFNETNGSYTYVVLNPIPGVPGSEFTNDPGAGTFTIDGRNVPLAVDYVTEYRLTTGLSPNGAGSILPASGWFPAGGTVNLSAVAARGYAFVAWQGSGMSNYSGTSDPATLVMHSPEMETAVFESHSVLSFQITFGVSPNGSGSIIFNGGSYSVGQTVVVPAGSYSLAEVPASGYQFAGWAASDGITIGSGTTNVAGSGWINATNVAIHLVSIVTDPISCGSVSVAGNVYANGASIALPSGSYNVTASACAGFSLVSITGSGGVGIVTGEMNVSGNGSVLATFTAHLTATTAGNQAAQNGGLWALLIGFGALAATLVFYVRRRPRDPPAASELLAFAPATEPVPEWNEDGEPLWVKRRPPS